MCGCGGQAAGRDTMLSGSVTKWITKPIQKPSAQVVQGIAIGEGPCKRLRLSVNAYERDSDTLVHPSNFYIYYGDSKGQEKMLLIIDPNGAVNPWDSDWIECNDLNEVFVRIPPIAGYPGIIDLQVEIELEPNV